MSGSMEKDSGPGQEKVMHPFPLEIMMVPYGYFGGGYGRITLAELALATLPACGGDAAKAIEAARLIMAADDEEKKRRDKAAKELEAAETRLAQLHTFIMQPEYGLLSELRGYVQEHPDNQTKKGGGARLEVVKALDVVHGTQGLHAFLRTALLKHMPKPPVERTVSSHVVLAGGPS